MSFKAAPTASNAGHSKRLLVGSKRKLPRREGREHTAGPDRRTARSSCRAWPTTSTVSG